MTKELLLHALILVGNIIVAICCIIIYLKNKKIFNIVLKRKEK
jgi:hypothetical protein